MNQKRIKDPLQPKRCVCHFENGITRIIRPVGTLKIVGDGLSAVFFFCLFFTCLQILFKAWLMNYIFFAFAICKCQSSVLLKVDFSF